VGDEVSQLNLVAPAGKAPVAIAQLAKKIVPKFQVVA
jgi:hypothetical protein